MNFRLIAKKIFILAIIISIVSLNACDIPQDKRIEQKDSLKIAVINYKADDAFINSMSRALTASMRLREHRLQRKIVLNIFSAKADQNYQNILLDRILKQGYDAVCINIVERYHASYIINRCKKANVPVVFFNREPTKADLLAWDKAYYVGSVAVQAGRIQGDMIVELLKNKFDGVDVNKDDKIQYVIIEGESGHQDTLYRSSEALNRIQTAGYNMDKLEGDTANWSSKQAFLLMDKWLNSLDEHIELVISNNDEMAIGAIQALRKSAKYKLRMPVVVGIDAIPAGVEAIESSLMYGTVINDAINQAAAIADIAVSLAMKEKPNEDRIKFLEGNYAYIPYRPLTRKDLNDERKKLVEVK